jgi:hypothetical protein
MTSPQCLQGCPRAGPRAGTITSDIWFGVDALVQRGAGSRFHFFFFFLTQKMRGTAEPWYRQPPKRGGTAAEKFQAFLKFWAGNRRAEAAGGG